MEYRCWCGHFEAEHTFSVGCAGCDAGGKPIETIEHNYEADINESATEFHYLVTHKNGRKYWLWANNKKHARELAKQIEPKNNPVTLIEECEHRCPWNDVTQ